MTQMTEKAYRSLGSAMWRGWKHKCPRCGEGSMFAKYLKVHDNCQTCGLEMHHHRADDAPPYFTIFIVGHLIVIGMLWMETAFVPPIWLHMTVWIPVTIISSLALLSPIKGALVGLQWALRMHGFDQD